MKIHRAVITACESFINKYRINKYDISISNNTVLNGCVSFVCDEKSSITIGEGVCINSGRKYNQIGGDTRTLIRTMGSGNITIGDNVGISNSSFIAMASIIIEEDVKIGGSCKIYDNDFHSIAYEFRMETPDTHIKRAPICIRKGAFIGAHSIILKGVTIGEKSIVGAGSVVTKDIPDGEIWGGNPARFIKKMKEFE